MFAGEHRLVAIFAGGTEQGVGMAVGPEPVYSNPP